MGEINQEEWNEMIKSGYVQFNNNKKKDIFPVILFGFDYKRGKAYVGHGRLTAKFIKPDKKGRITYNMNKYYVVELPKSKDYKEWH